MHLIYVCMYTMFVTELSAAWNSMSQAKSLVGLTSLLNADSSLICGLE